YTFSAAAFSEVSALQPVGPVATTINILTGLFSGIIVLVLVLSLVVGYRQSGEDHATSAAITGMRADADAIEERLAADYGLDRDGLWDRLYEVGGGVLKLIPFLFARRPSAQGDTRDA